jgi:hypothetical protein
MSSDAQVSDTSVNVTWLDRVNGVAHLFVPAQVWQLARTSAILFLAGSVAVGGWIVGASASQDSLPGEPLYGVKLAIEKTEVAVADAVASPRVAAAKELDFAARRVTEIKNSLSTEQKVVALQSLQQSMQSANKRLEDTVQNSPEQALALAQVVNEKTEQILDTLHASTVIPALTSSSTVATSTPDSAVVTQVQKTEQLIEQTGVQAVQVLIDKGDNDSVKETVEKKLEKVTTDITDVAAQAASVIASSTIVTSDVADTLLPASATGTLSTSGTTSILVPATIVESVVPVMTNTTSVQLLSGAKQVQEKIGAAKDLLDDNNLRGALQKVKELYDIKNEAKDVVIKIDIAKNAALNAVSNATKTATSTTVTGTVMIIAVPVLGSANPATGTTSLPSASTALPGGVKSQ